MTGRRFFIVRRDDVDAGHLEVLERGPVSKLEGKPLPFTAGEELDVKLEAKDRYAPGDAVARRNGHVIAVADAAGKVGKTVRIRIERATPELVYAVLAAAPTGEAPVEAGVEVESDGAGEPRKSTRGSRGGRGRKPAAEETEQAAEKPKPAPRTRKKAEPKKAEPKPAVEAEPTQVAAAAETDGAPEGEVKPKKKTRRGSRGGRGRKKKTTTATATTEQAAASNGEPDAQPVPAPVPEPVAEAEPSANGGEPGAEEQPKPKKKTRRGSRGGRNRRKKPAAPVDGAPDGSGPAEEPVAAVAPDEERG
jgi:predicted RNA-binding protein with TRAM domain